MRAKVTQSRRRPLRSNIDEVLPSAPECQKMIRDGTGSDALGRPMADRLLAVPPLTREPQATGPLALRRVRFIRAA